MSLNGKEQSVLPIVRGPTVVADMADDPAHYVLVFPSPYYTDKDISIDLNEKKPIKELLKIYTNTFRMLHRTSAGNDVHAKRTRDTEEQWNKFVQVKAVDDSLFFRDFLEFMLMEVVFVLQDHLNLEVKLFYSRDKDEIFCKLTAAEENLRIHADLIDYRLQMRKDEKDGNFYYTEVAPYARFERRPEKGSSELMSYFVSPDVEKSYRRFDEYDEDVFPGDKRWETASVFRYKDKVRIIMDMVSNAMDVGVMIQNRILTTHYPLHKPHQLVSLKRDWASIFKFYKPQNDNFLRLYFGEKIAIYFSWLSFYIRWLYVPAVFGLAVFIIELYFKDSFKLEIPRPIADTIIGDGKKKVWYMSLYDISLFGFSIMLAISSSLMEVLWIRKEKEQAWRWGMTDLEEVETQRPQFDGEFSKDEVTGKLKKKPVSVIKQKAKRSIAMTISLLFVSAVLALILALFTYKKNDPTDSLGIAQFTALINACQIKVMNFIYTRVAKMMNNWENYETEQQYNDALTIKLYLFQFINSYTSLFYIAFAKKHYDGCRQGDCMLELKIQLCYIIAINVSLNLLELGWPYVSNWLAMRSEKKKLEELKKKGKQVRETMTQAEAQAKLSAYETPLDDYMEMVINYGYVVMFSIAFPIVPFIALFMASSELRIDAWKLVNLCRRPYPDVAGGIGVWYKIIQTISFVGALTNTAILSFTTNVLHIEDKEDERYVWILFLTLEHGLLLFKFIIAVLVSDTPLRVRHALTWSARIVNERIYAKAVDVDEQQEMKSLFFKDVPGYTQLQLQRDDILTDDF
jgi:hypothetical protein